MNADYICKRPICENRRNLEDQHRRQGFKEARPP
jgi:hypothetical protein